MSIVRSDDNTVSIILEDEVDFSLYKKQRYPFLTFNLKIPALQKKKNRKTLRMKATLCYNPYVVTDEDSIADYNPCTISFYIHRGSDDATPIKEGSSSSYLENLTKLTWGKWSDEPNTNDFWNNSQTNFYEITKREYNKFVSDGLRITFRSTLKENSEAIEYYKAHPQKFSFVLSICDGDEEWIIYDNIKNLNNLQLANTNIAQTQLKAIINP